jgi:hypothetical protein
MAGVIIGKSIADAAPPWPSITSFVLLGLPSQAKQKLFSSRF